MIGIKFYIVKPIDEDDCRYFGICRKEGAGLVIMWIKVLNDMTISYYETYFSYGGIFNPKFYPVEISIREYFMFNNMAYKLDSSFVDVYEKRYNKGN